MPSVWDDCENCGQVFENAPDCPNICGECERNGIAVINVKTVKRLQNNLVQEEKVLNEGW